LLALSCWALVTVFGWGVFAMFKAIAATFTS
jgi:hypothetical protein